MTVDFRASGLDGVEEITSLDAPHRVYDAILRDSDLDGKPFMESEFGLRVARANTADASALLELSPNALLLGSWHSTGQGGGLGAKFARCLVSEIIAVDVPVDQTIDPRTGEEDVVTSGRRTGSRMDPLGVLRKVEVFKSDTGWGTTAREAGAKAKKVRPSEINHGNIAPTVQPLGVTCDYAEQTFVLTFAGLRRLRFGDDERTHAGRALLAALGILGALQQDRRGYALRSRCDLVCEGRAPMEIVRSDGSHEVLNIDLDGARSLYNEAFEAAQAAGFTFRDEPLRLMPQKKLIEIVRQSQEQALAGLGGEDAISGDD